MPANSCLAKATLVQEEDLPNMIEKQPLFVTIACNKAKSADAAN